MPASAGFDNTPHHPHSVLELAAITKAYQGNVSALKEITLQIQEGEFLSLLGPSGSGKTTLLMIIGGFIRPTSGRVLFKGADITVLPPQRRNFGVVFQNYALFPHLTVLGNVIYPLAARRVGRRTRDEQARATLSLVGLAGLEDRKPSQLSGGQQQRVALARALVYGPSLLLLDEPLGALDRNLRERMQIELKRLHKMVGVTVLYVTHDQEEALTMSDRIVVIHEGTIEQIGTPEEVYARPASRFVASFVGHANLIPAQVVERRRSSADCRLLSGVHVEVPCSPSDDAMEHQALILIRPERVIVSAPSDSNLHDGGVMVDGILNQVTFSGSSWRHEITTNGGEMITSEMASILTSKPGESVRVSWNPADTWLVPSPFVNPSDSHASTTIRSAPSQSQPPEKPGLECEEIADAT